MKTRAFSYQRIINRRDKLFNTAVRPYIDAELSGETLHDLCDDVLRALPDSVAGSAVFESLRILAGTVLTRRAAADLAWRLAGNVEKLQAGVPVFPWAGQMEDEKVPVCVEDMRPMRRKNTPGYVLYCRALAGSPCPMLFTQFVSLQSCRGLASAVGFSKPWGPYPYENPLHFINLIFYAHVEVDRSLRQPGFLKISATAGMIKENRNKIEIRCRARPCPEQFPHSCAACWVGYDNCPAAVHPHTYVMRDCPTCKSPGLFNPGDAGLLCQQCRHRAEREEQLEFEE